MNRCRTVGLAELATLNIMLQTGHVPLEYYFYANP